MARATVVKKASRTATGKPVAIPVGKAKPKARKPSNRASAEVVTMNLPAAMTGRASPAKAAEGDEPVFAYIRSLPQPQRGIAERVDALAAKTLPALKRSVKWVSALKPVPPIMPVGMGKDSRGVDLKSLGDLDERQAAS